MQRISVYAVIGGFVLAGAVAMGNTVMGDPALATNNTVARQAQYRRALADCMKKRMGASRTISYNDAAQVCKDQMKPERDALEANNEARPANAH